MKIIISGGGTAGHINPGIAIGKYLRDKKGYEVIFIGSEKGIENKLVPLEGFLLEKIKVRGFRRKISLEVFVTIKELIFGLSRAKKILKKHNPDFVIGTGGYVSGPVLYAASKLKIPTLIQEQNAFPGMTNKILSKRVDAICMSFSESAKFFKSNNLKVTGSPIRSEMIGVNKKSARKELGIDEKTKLVVIFGGSRGAENVNDQVADMLVNNHKEKDFDIIYATGQIELERIGEKLKGGISENVKIVPYIFDMAKTMGSADIVVSRAGAITIAELTAMGVPSILIPSPYVTANHQEQNARVLECEGAAVLITEKDLNAELLYNKIIEIINDDEKLASMAKNAKRIGTTDATEKIFDIMQEILSNSARRNKIERRRKNTS